MNAPDPNFAGTKAMLAMAAELGKSGYIRVYPAIEIMNEAPKVKIGRLPKTVQEQVNRRLDSGEKGRPLAWLNSLPEVRAVLAAEFAGQPIREQNRRRCALPAQSENSRASRQCFQLLEISPLWHTALVATTNPASHIKPKVAVLGTGSLGQHHARIYSELDAAGQVELTGIFDANPETARKIADKHKLKVFASIAEAAAASDALNIATPTTTHFEIAKTLLAQGKHVLVEKPMTASSAQAAELCQIAQQKNCVLQVGHVERFNPVFKFLETVATEPKFIECHRLSPFPARSTDIGVVLDLMIHDLDVVLAFVKSPVTSVDAVGIPVLSKSEDIANARLRFANGCIANLTVSRISPERMRKIRVFSGPANPCYISLDYRAQEGFIFRVAREGEEETPLLKKILAAKLGVGKNSAIVSEFAGRKIVREPVPIAKDEPLKLELQSFINCVRERQTPVVSGESAKRALDLAFEITRQIQHQATNNR